MESLPAFQSLSLSDSRGGGMNTVRIASFLTKNDSLNLIFSNISEGTSFFILEFNSSVPCEMAQHTFFLRTDGNSQKQFNIPVFHVCPACKVDVRNWTLKACVHIQPDSCVVDGLSVKNLEGNQRTLLKGVRDYTDEFRSGFISDYREISHELMEESASRTRMYVESNPRFNTRMITSREVQVELSQPLIITSSTTVRDQKQALSFRKATEIMRSTLVVHLWKVKDMVPSLHPHMPALNLNPSTEEYYVIADYLSGLPPIKKAWKDQTAQNGTGRNGTGQNGTGQNGTGQNGTLPLPVLLTPGSTYSISVQTSYHSSPDALITVNRTDLIQTFRAEYTVQELQRLLEKGRTIKNNDSNAPSSPLPIKWMYRHKPKEYYDDIFYYEGGIMHPYIKNNNGDPASRINGKIYGLFFSVNVHFSTKEPMMCPFFGKCCLKLPCCEIMMISNLYFADVL